MIRYGIPKSTLFEYLKKAVAGINVEKLRRCGRLPVLSEDDENQLEMELLKAAEFEFLFDVLELKSVVQEFLNQSGRKVSQFK